jgi:hypothetical protein
MLKAPPRELWPAWKQRDIRHRHTAAPNAAKRRELSLPTILVGDMLNVPSDRCVLEIKLIADYVNIGEYCGLSRLDAQTAASPCRGRLVEDGLIPEAVRPGRRCDGHARP